MGSLSYWSVRAYGKEAPFKIAAVINYEVGDVVRNLSRMETYPDYKDDYMIELKNSLGDVLAMAQLLCDMLGLDFSDIYMKGYQKAVERCKETIEGKSGF